MQVGTICYATPSGLGHLAKAFYDNNIINRILVIQHPRYKDMSEEWYKPEHTFRRMQHDEFLNNLDVLIIFENVFQYWNVVDKAKKRGIKVVLVPMYEWTPNPLPVEPDLVACPSLLDIRYFSKYPNTFIQIPVDTDTTHTNHIIPRQRTVANTFVHNAGHGQVGLTKGTPEVIEAFHLIWHNIKNSTEYDWMKPLAEQEMAKPGKPTIGEPRTIKLILRGQPAEQRVKELLNRADEVYNPIIKIQSGDLPYTSLFLSGDVYVNAEQYNGLSLPLQEAYASGMPVISTKRFPMDTWLPNELLVEPFKITQHRVNQTTFERSHVAPDDLMRKILDSYGTDISKYSQMGIEWGQANNWTNKRQEWIDLLESIL